MANTEKTFIPYFKIRWARKSTWTLEQAAYLSCGKDPESKEYKISANETNSVSKRYFWLLNKLKKESLQILETIEGIEYFNPGSLFRLLDEKFTVDKDMRKAVDHMYDEISGIKSKTVTRSVYREAARLIFRDYPSATKAEVAQTLRALPEHYNLGQHGHIESLEAHQIEELIKGLTSLSGKTKHDDKRPVLVSLEQLVQRL